MFGEKKALLLGAVGAVVFGTTLWKYFDRKGEQKLVQVQQSVADDLLIKFLKELRAQCFPHFFLVAGIVRQMKQQNQAEYEQVFPKVKQEVDILFQKKQTMILYKLELNSEDVQKSIEISQNAQVKELSEQLQVFFNDALDGIDPPLKMNSRTINKYTQKQLLTIMNKVLRVSVDVICNAVAELERTGKSATEYKLDQPEFMKALNLNKLSDRKLEVLEKENLTEFEEDPDSCPTELFSKLVQFNKLKTPLFKKCVDQIESHFEFIISKLLKKEIDFDAARAASEKIDLGDIIKILK